jgi:hypothetical protein
VAFASTADLVNLYVVPSCPVIATLRREVLVENIPPHPERRPSVVIVEIYLY